MRRKLVAILRGMRPEEAEAIGAALIEAGITMIEVPLNSPDPMTSIEILAQRYDGDALVGAGTVLSAGQVNEVASAGGKLIVSPNFQPAVIARTLSLGLVSMPGAFTPTECLAALAAGARSIKLFPAEVAGPAGLKAMKAVLPAAADIFAVGGVAAGNCAEWAHAGAGGLGIGGGLYKPGDGAAAVAARAREIVAAFDAAFNYETSSTQAREI